MSCMSTDSIHFTVVYVELVGMQNRDGLLGKYDAIAVLVLPVPYTLIGEAKKITCCLGCFWILRKGRSVGKKFFLINLFYLYNTVYRPMIGLDPVSIIVQQGLLLNVTMLMILMS